MNLQPIVPQYKRTCIVFRSGVIHEIFISIHLNVKYCTLEKIIQEMITECKLKPTLSMYKLAQKKKIWALHSITYGSLMYIPGIQNAVSKANRMIGILRHTFTFLDKDTSLQLYKTFIMPHVEYVNAIWYPCFNRQSAAMKQFKGGLLNLFTRLKTRLIQRDYVHYH